MPFYFLILVLCFSSFVFTAPIASAQAPSQSSESGQLEIVSLNLRWYGSTHFPPHNDDERDQHLPIFFQKHYPNTAIFLFQEVTDPLRLEKVLGQDFQCLTTRQQGSSFQYVVTCYDSLQLQAINTNEQETFASDRSLDISFGQYGLRNALHLVFAIKQSPKRQIQTINLHLRAQPDHSQFRIRQMSALFDHIQQMSLASTALVIGGDFNSYTKSSNGQTKDDIYLFLDESDQKGLILYTEFGLPTHLSYRSERFFDYFLVSNPDWLSSYDLFPACTVMASAEVESYKNQAYYKKFISDHCPLSLNLPVKDL